MTAVQKVRALYERFPQPRTFEEDLEAHFCTGFVCSTPDHFVMARAVCRNAAPELLANPWELFPDPDTWLIWAAAGLSAVSVKTFCLTVCPFPLTWVAWARRNAPLRFHLLSP